MKMLVLPYRTSIYIEYTQQDKKKCFGVFIQSDAEICYDSTKSSLYSTILTVDYVKLRS